MSYKDTTNVRISLDTLAKSMSLKVLKNAEIYSVGKVPSQGQARLVPCSAMTHLKEALNFDDIVAVVVPPSLAAQVPDNLGIVESATPQQTAYDIHEYLCHLEGHYWENFESNIDPTASIHETAHIASMNVIIGPHTVIEAGTIIKERSLIGSNCTIGPMAVIGGSAFETRQKDGRQKILLQAGGVKIGDNVVIQSLSNVDCATFTGFTTIDDETGLDSLIHVAHDCSIGKRVKIAASATISGRVTIDDDSYLGPNCTISNGVKIGKDAKVSIGAVVIQDIGPSQTVSGNFAIDHRKWLRFLSKLKNGKI